MAVSFGQTDAAVVADHRCPVVIELYNNTGAGFTGFHYDPVFSQELESGAAIPRHVHSDSSPSATGAARPAAESAAASGAAAEAASPCLLPKDVPPPPPHPAHRLRKKQQCTNPSAVGDTPQASVATRARSDQLDAAAGCYEVQCLPAAACEP